MLYTKSILKPKEESDGIRISVMSRHTHNDGITPDERIDESSLYMHLKSLAPSPKLIGGYYKRNLSWEGFEQRYFEEIQEESKKKLVEFLAHIAVSQDDVLKIQQTNVTGVYLLKNVRNMNRFLK